LRHWSLGSGLPKDDQDIDSVVRWSPCRIEDDYSSIGACWST
jgi:hypothetical protein